MGRPLNILCVQNDAISPAGFVGEMIYRRGGQLDEVMPQEGDALPADHGRYDGVLVLGGAMDAFDDEKNPQFQPLIRLLQGFHAAEKPILGICLGAQLVARTFEKPVYRHRELELGFTEIEITEAGAATPLLDGLERRQWVMEWHQDTFDLPDGAELLATGERCRNQAFRIGRHVYAFQFHFEASRTILRSWVRANRDFLKQQHPYFTARIEADLAQHMPGQAALARRVAGRWLDLVEARTDESAAARAEAG
jgi:GMP synthase (glutamine-hydrolysing)